MSRKDFVAIAESVRESVSTERSKETGRPARELLCERQSPVRPGPFFRRVRTLTIPR